MEGKGITEKQTQIGPYEKMMNDENQEFEKNGIKKRRTNNNQEITDEERRNAGVVYRG